jgi:hypothetical protein
MKALLMEEYKKLRYLDVPDPRIAGEYPQALLSEGQRWFDKLYNREDNLLKGVLIP